MTTTPSSPSLLRRIAPPVLIVLSVAVLGLMSRPSMADEHQGYYRFPAIHGQTIVFTAEGDLWTVSVDGGKARRLTTHAAAETHAALSPDGSHIAFSAGYEGEDEVYLMPVEGGRPQRLTFHGETSTVRGFAPDGRVLYSTRHFSTLPDAQLVLVDPENGHYERLPLAQASQGVLTDDGTLFFTRLAFQGSHTKRYRGGTAEQLWRFRAGDPEATPLTSDFDGTSRSPMLWRDRLYFASDRDGTINLWSSDLAGNDLQQHTAHVGWDVLSPSQQGGRIVYQLGADLRLLDLNSGDDRLLTITLASDFDQQRPRWIDQPMEFLTAAHLSPKGDQVVLTARGQIFTTPVAQGRRARVTSEEGVRHRSARFLRPDRLLALSDESDEVELWSFDSRGVQPRKRITAGADILRFDHLPSPDARWTVMWDRNHHLWLVDLKSGEYQRIAASPYFQFRGIAWSPDSRYLAYGMNGENHLSRIWVHRLEEGDSVAVTSNRYDSYDPAWSPDGKWLYFLSDRHLESLSQGPWGNYQPSPLLTERSQIFQLALQPGQRSPFAPVSELFPETAGKGSSKKANDASSTEKKGSKTPAVDIQWQGLSQRLHQVPVPPGDYRSLQLNDRHLFWLTTSLGKPQDRAMLRVLEITREAPKAKTVLHNVANFELSRDGKKILAHRAAVEDSPQGKDAHGALFVFDAGAKAPEPLAEHRVDLGGWTFRLDPREEWRQMFTDAWRLHRDYFYDPGMHGVDWRAMHAKYLPLVDRITDRDELGDLFAQMVGELAALHHFVRGGDQRTGDDEDVLPASLGAVLARDEAAGGYRIEHLYETDPDLPQRLAPLARPGVDAKQGDLLLAINGRSVLDVRHPGELLRRQAGRQVLLRLADGDGSNPREAIATPLDPDGFEELRYDAWEYERRLRVEQDGEGQLGYIHLRAMGASNYSEWARDYFPVFHRRGLILDMRHNRGGNIDSWILGSLLRRPWMWWKGRTGMTYPNMQQSFGGHIVVLCDQWTASDGENLLEGFRRLGLGKVIGARTWGGEIWLTSSNTLVDGGIATAAEFGVYGPEGVWLIEGEGVHPDIEVDNLPHATFGGQDAQLDAAIRHLQELIVEDPRVTPEPPPYPDKSSPDNRPPGQNPTRN